MGLVGLAFASGWAFSVSVPFEDGQLSFAADSAGGTPAIFTYVSFVIGIGLILVGVTLEVSRHFSERKESARRKVIAIEIRGLRDQPGSPLLDDLPKRVIGKRVPVTLDLRQRVQDGVVVDPDAAIAKLQSLPVQIGNQTSGLDRIDLTYVLGGLAPVPFSFLAGTLIDDEGPLEIFDWDRHNRCWRSLDGIDDGERFHIEGIDEIKRNTEAVALAVSVSYRVDDAAALERTGLSDIVRMTLEGGNPDSHWSIEKQKELGKQFLNTVIAIGNLGVKRIHLFLAAQSSVVFRFGTLYDKRNLPIIQVYQYEKDQEPEYPWSVQMPVAGNEEAKTVR